jgi:hypothetical protein
MKNPKNLHMKPCLSLLECGLSEDLSEEETMMKKTKKNSQECGDLFPKQLNNQMLVFASIISGVLLLCNGFIGMIKFQLMLL